MRAAKSGTRAWGWTRGTPRGRYQGFRALNRARVGRRQVCHDTLSPQWGARFSLRIPPGGADLRVEVFDHDSFSRRPGSHANLAAEATVILVSQTVILTGSPGFALYMDGAHTRGNPSNVRSENRDYGSYGREISVETRHKCPGTAH